MTHTTYTSRPRHDDHTKGPAMPATRRLTAAATAALVLLAVTLLSPAAAFARVAPDLPASVQPASVTDPPTRLAGSAGSPLWVFLLVALVAAAVTAILVLVILKLRHRTAPRFAH